MSVRKDTVMNIIIDTHEEEPDQSDKEENEDRNDIETPHAFGPPT